MYFRFLVSCPPSSKPWFKKGFPDVRWVSLRCPLLSKATSHHNMAWIFCRAGPGCFPSQIDRWKENSKVMGVWWLPLQCFFWSGYSASSEIGRTLLPDIASHISDLESKWTVHGLKVQNLWLQSMHGRSLWILPQKRGPPKGAFPTRRQNEDGEVRRAGQ